MSATVLGGDFTVYYSDDNRQKRIEWTGSTNPARTMNELYSALQDLFDETTQMDDGIPMSAQTPVEYTIGKIDAGDNDPWYISYDALEHLSSGALRTASWARIQDSNTGIVVVAVTSASRTIVTADIGYDVTHGDGDTGTLLDIIDVGGTDDYLIIRPDSDVIGNNFDNATGTITSARGAFTGAVAAAAVTGEQVWANIYSIGTIAADTHIYVYQGEVATDGDRIRVYSISDQTQDWWSDGHVDICVPLNDYTVAGATTIDGGNLSVFARQYAILFANFEVSNSITSGGRNPVPLGTGTDLDNTTGYKQVTLTTPSGNFSVGDEIEGQTSGARAILTAVSGSPTFEYYLIDDPQTDFNGSEIISNNDDTGTSAGSGSPSDAGPALATWFTNNTPPTIGFTHTTADINDDGTSEFYGVVIDCNQNPLTEVYEWAKYKTRRGEQTTMDGITGESYIGCEAYLRWDGATTPSGAFTEGSDVTQETSGATGVVVSYFDSGGSSGGYVLLRDIRGTFVTHATTATLTSNDDTETVEIDGAAVNFAPKSASPLGTFAGGTFFGARGVLLTDYLTADANSFQLTDATGTVRTRPVSINLIVSNLVGTDETTITDDRVAVFRLTGAGGDIDKTEYSAYAGEVPGDATLDVDTAIAVDVPGKSTGGVLRIRDADDSNKEYRIRYDSWANTGGAGTDGSFTLSNFAAFVSTGGDTDTIVYATGGFNAAVKRGDLVWNTTQSEVSYVISVDNDTTLQVSPAFSGSSSGDTLEINCVPITINTADDVFVPLIDTYASAATASASIVFDTTIYFKAVVRNVAATDPDGPLVPFASTDSITGSDKSIATIRTIDTIYQ